jgi:hypothetical protein
MNSPKGRLTVLILIAIFGIAVWSKTRFIEGDAYSSPQRWKVDEHPSFMQQN